MIRIDRSRPWPKLLAVLALGVAAFVPSSAQGAPPTHQPLINDAVGDTGYICSDNVLIGVPARCGRELPSTPAPAADIVQGDISLEGGGSLVFETTVVDLDDPAAQAGAYAAYSMTAVTGDVRIRVNATRTFPAGPPYATVTVENTATDRAVTGPVDNTFDDAGNTVVWEVALSTLNASIAHVCPTCGDVRRGTTLTGISAAAEFREPWTVFAAADTANATRDYTIGDN